MCFSGTAIRHEFVTGLYLQTVRGSQGVDSDVQVGLGVLFNISGEYDKAVDCFSAALQARPTVRASPTLILYDFFSFSLSSSFFLFLFSWCRQDYILWNRLGATLANGGRSEEAIDAYYKALNLKPSFVRARYNLGVSCINIGCYKEAAEHFLGALSLHGETTHRKNVSSSLWDTLRRTFLMMERRDLFEKAQANTLELFRGEFEF